ncbi:MAG TPA: hypothetical protein PLS84_00320 [Salinivirgaceae bacterium]|nr:hypothetical protein [Salinivirgaceae bacterium]
MKETEKSNALLAIMYVFFRILKAMMKIFYNMINKGLACRVTLNPSDKFSNVGEGSP